jgi:hypothetical protein
VTQLFEHFSGVCFLFAWMARVVSGLSAINGVLCGLAMSFMKDVEIGGFSLWQLTAINWLGCFLFLALSFALTVAGNKMSGQQQTQS